MPEDMPWPEAAIILALMLIPSLANRAVALLDKA
jgi:hypothetical protein